MVNRSSFVLAESQSVNATLQRIESEIRNLEVARIKYRRRKNELDAATSAVPNEVLSAIFEAVCDIPENSPYQQACYPLVLASVCFHWQKLVSRTPSLWRGLDLHLYHPAKASRISLIVLRSYVHRLRALPLSLRVSCNQTIRHRHLSRGDIVPVDDLFRVILEECPEKLGSLVLDEVPRSWWPLLSPLPSPSTKLPRLKRLALSWSEQYREPPLEPFQRDMVPELKSVSLSGERLPIVLPWDQITTLELKNMNIGQCIGLLLLCPLLVEYRCQGTVLSTDSQGIGYPLLGEVKVLPHMERVAWDFGLCIWDTILMKRVLFPNLRSMSWRKHSYTASYFISPPEQLKETSYRSIRNQFMSQSQSLTVFDGSLSLWTIEELFKILPRTLEELYLTDGHGAATLDTFRFLTLNDDTPNTNIFPNLRILSTPFLCPPQPNNCDPATVAMGMLRSRREGPPEKWEHYQRIRLIRLICPVSIMYTGWAVHYDELAQLISEGLEVEEEERRFEGAATSVATHVGINYLL